MKYATIEIISGETVEEIKVEESIFLAANKVFEEQGLTMEQALELFIRHVAEHGVPLTAEEIQVYMDEQQRKAADSKTLPSIAQMHHISADYLTVHFDEATELCDEHGVICIERNGKPDLVMMTIELYEDWTGEKIELPNCGTHE